MVVKSSLVCNKRSEKFERDTAETKQRGKTGKKQEKKQWCENGKSEAVRKILFRTAKNVRDTEPAISRDVFVIHPVGRVNRRLFPKIKRSTKELLKNIKTNRTEFVNEFSLLSNR
jgi:hypothetical protein